MKLYLTTFLLLATLTLSARITTVTHLDRPHFRITTRTATYLYDIAGGGFSSIIDRLGNDWVAHQREPWDQYPASAASSYRGVPNFVFRSADNGAGHPGWDQCQSRIVGRNKIHTISTSGKWAWTVTFYPNCARFDVVESDPEHPYWFLYEGPAGGSYQPETTYWATDVSDPSYQLYDHYRGGVYEGLHRYMFFGENQSPYSLFMLQKEVDEQVDHISYLGNAEVGAAESPDGMVVAGLGRGPDSTPLLTGPNTFLIGLLPYNLSDPIQLLKARSRLTKIASRRTR
ncbi:hypothetical protein LEM8419_02831 [Neolewinella maritima]|uniref:Uncharacterized protein n=1 Tax=Neolewinella maritima TaxID=1383882 RepID=A0ABN8F8L1_9BACT|nr:hypothetical protein [Neolewinella maritima]CAH1001917.1 hypothetical protein LEM8419_02831 [Neolewinella maritima]